MPMILFCDRLTSEYAVSPNSKELSPYIWTAGSLSRAGSLETTFAGYNDIIIMRPRGSGKIA